jgi:UDP-galactopyranose mutase
MTATFDLICLSHLRWDFVYQRPHHLMSRFARERRVFFVEEPILDEGGIRLETRTSREGVHICVPHFSAETDSEARHAITAWLLDELLADFAIQEHVLWFYTPMATASMHNLKPLATVYDCMDELSAFSGAPSALRRREQALFGIADLVFTGGRSLYEAKRAYHPFVHCFPSSVDVAHFRQARDANLQPPADQSDIPGPRIGFFGVIDERMDLDLLEGVAAARPEWHLVLVGPVADGKIDAATLPRRKNIHYLGNKSYDELPLYLAGWDVTILPFARNESTRYISPTKTPEYLAAGRPVVSTPIRDIVNPYGQRDLVRVADGVSEFVEAIEAALAEDSATRLPRVDDFLRSMSWDRTWTEMRRLIDDVVEQRRDDRRIERSVIADRIRVQEQANV